jgi:zinc transport system substrate-binding protein
MTAGKIPRHPVLALPVALWALMALSPAARSFGAGRGADTPNPPPSQTVRVFVSILPEAFFVERIGADAVAVEVMIGPGESPATFDPTPKTMQRLAGAGAYFAIGVPMETVLLPQIRRNFPDVRIVDTTAGIAKRPLTEDEGSDHAAGSDHTHQALETDPHIWLSPRRAAIVARNIADALVQLDPARAARYRANLDTLNAELNALQTEIADILEPVAGRDLLVFHPAYGYLADDFGMRQIAIQHGGVEPGPRQLADLMEQVRRRGARAIFVQPQFSMTSARTLAAEIGVEVVVLDPLARDYPDNLRRMARAIRQALAP